jgi:hypothetical protein
VVTAPAPAAKPVVTAPAPAAKPVVTAPAPAAKPVVTAPAPAAKPTLGPAPAPAAPPKPPNPGFDIDLYEGATFTPAPPKENPDMGILSLVSSSSYAITHEPLSANYVGISCLTNVKNDDSAVYVGLSSNATLDESSKTPWTSLDYCIMLNGTGVQPWSKGSSLAAITSWNDITTSFIAEYGSYRRNLTPPIQDVEVVVYLFNGQIQFKVLDSPVYPLFSEATSDKTFYGAFACYKSGEVTQLQWS